MNENNLAALKGNVLVIGNSGVGKSTLINAVVGDDVAEVFWGTTSGTKEIKAYENPTLPFRLIDTIGFEPDFFKKWKAIHAVKKWMHKGLRQKRNDANINVIWFCVSGTERKLFTKTIESLLKATETFKSVPIIVVITKSYSVPEREENIQMVYDAFATFKSKERLIDVIPVVAETYVLNEDAFAAPTGIATLIERTNSILPAGVKAAEGDIFNYLKHRKLFAAQRIVLTSTLVSLAAHIVPGPIVDDMIQKESIKQEVSRIAKIYDIPLNDQTKKILEAALKNSSDGLMKKFTVGKILQKINKKNLPVQLVAAVISASVVFVYGQAAIYAFEQVAVGKKSLEDVQWLSALLSKKFDEHFFEQVAIILNNVADNGNAKNILKNIYDVLNIFKKQS